MFKNIFTKETGILVLLFIGAIVLMTIDPLNLAPLGVNDTSVLPVLYFIPTVVIWFFYFARPHLFGSKSLNDVQKRELIYLQVKSVLRKLLAVLAAFVMSGFSKNIPFLDFVNDIITYISNNLEVGYKALEVLIGIALGLISHFSKINRFEERVTLHPRKVEL